MEKCAELAYWSAEPAEISPDSPAAGTPKRPECRNSRTAGMPGMPDLSDFAGQISLALPAEYQSNPEIRRFCRFCRSEIATLV